MRASSHTIQRETAGNGDIIDPTDELQELVAAEGIRTGQVTAPVDLDTRPRRRTVAVVIVGE